MEFLLVFLVTSPLTVSMVGAEEAGIKARLLVCVMTRSLASRWLLRAACRPLSTLLALADCVRVVSGVFRCRMRSSYRSCISDLGPGSGLWSMLYLSTVASALRLFISAALSACRRALCRSALPWTGIGLNCFCLSFSRSCQLVCALRVSSTGPLCAMGGAGGGGGPPSGTPGGPCGPCGPCGPGGPGGPGGAGG